jgi:hypothetical protein
MVPLLVAVGIWLLVVSLAGLFVVRNLPVEVSLEKSAQVAAVPISDEEFLQRLQAIAKSYAKKRIKETKRKAMAKPKRSVKLENMLPLNAAFFFRNPINGEGTFARSLEEFLETLKNAPQEAIDFHMREGVNDFEDWVRYVVKDIELADELKRIKEEHGPDKQKLIKAIEKRVKAKKVAIKSVVKTAKFYA